MRSGAKVDDTDRFRAVSEILEIFGNREKVRERRVKSGSKPEATPRREDMIRDARRSLDDSRI